MVFIYKLNIKYFNVVSIFLVKKCLTLIYTVLINYAVKLSFSEAELIVLIFCTVSLF